MSLTHNKKFPSHERVAVAEVQAQADASMGVSNDSDLLRSPIHTEQTSADAGVRAMCRRIGAVASAQAQEAFVSQPETLHLTPRGLDGT